MVVQEASINNIMGGLEGAEGVKLHTHRRKLKQRFDIIKKLGQGTYGKVQLGINKETGQEVAIKTIKKAKIETEGDLIRIRREIQIMSSLRHPYIIHIYEVFENKDKIVLVMEYASGGELYDYLSQRKVLQDSEAQRLFRQIAMAVYYCHKHQICHRDLKLENILLDEDGNAKLADFGLSNVFDSSRLLSTFCGSPLYASPEIVSGIPYYGPEVDCWSLGVLLYTLVYGAMPFDGSNFKRLVKQISNGEYYEPKAPSSASGLIRSLLTVDGSERLDIVGVCSHVWLNSNEKETPCVKRALELSAEKPVRLDLLLSLNQPRNQPSVQPQTRPSVVKSRSVGSLPTSVNPTAAPSSQPQAELAETKAEKESKGDEGTSEVPAESIPAEQPADKAKKKSSKKSQSESESPPQVPQTPIKKPSKKISKKSLKEPDLVEETLTVETQLPESSQEEPAPDKQVTSHPETTTVPSPKREEPSTAPPPVPEDEPPLSPVEPMSPVKDFKLASTVHLDELIRSEIGFQVEPSSPLERLKKENALKVISHAISESAMSGERKSSTLPRRRLSRPEISPPVAPSWRSGGPGTAPVGGSIVPNARSSQFVYPTPAPRTSLSMKESKEDISGSSTPGTPRERIIPIAVEGRESSSSLATPTTPGPAAVQPQAGAVQSSTAPAAHPMPRQPSVRASSLSREGSDSGSSVSSLSMKGEPVRKSPREVIIPIAMEGGGYLTPPLREEESSTSTSVAGGTSTGSRVFGLASTRPPRPSMMDTQDSLSSDEDDDNFEILTAENLFSTLLSRVRSLTQRLNDDTGRATAFPRLFSHESVFDNPSWSRRRGLLSQHRLGSSSISADSDGMLNRASPRLIEELPSRIASDDLTHSFSSRPSRFSSATLPRDFLGTRSMRGMDESRSDCSSSPGRVVDRKPPISSRKKLSRAVSDGMESDTRWRQSGSRVHKERESVSERSEFSFGKDRLKDLTQSARSIFDKENVSDRASQIIGRSLRERSLDRFESSLDRIETVLEEFGRAGSLVRSRSSSRPRSYTGKLQEFRNSLSDERPSRSFDRFSSYDGSCSSSRRTSQSEDYPQEPVDELQDFIRLADKTQALIDRLQQRHILATSKSKENIVSSSSTENSIIESTLNDLDRITAKSSLNNNWSSSTISTNLDLNKQSTSSSRQSLTNINSPVFTGDKISSLKFDRLSSYAEGDEYDDRYLPSTSRSRYSAFTPTSEYGDYSIQNRIGRENLNNQYSRSLTTNESKYGTDEQIDYFESNESNKSIDGKFQISVKSIEKPPLIPVESTNYGTNSSEKQSETSELKKPIKIIKKKKSNDKEKLPKLHIDIPNSEMQLPEKNKSSTNNNSYQSQTTDNSQSSLIKNDKELGSTNKVQTINNTSTIQSIMKKKDEESSINRQSIIDRLNSIDTEIKSNNYTTKYSQESTSSIDSSKSRVRSTDLSLYRQDEVASSKFVSESKLKNQTDEVMPKIADKNPSVKEKSFKIDENLSERVKSEKSILSESLDSSHLNLNKATSDNKSKFGLNESSSIFEQKISLNAELDPNENTDLSVEKREEEKSTEIIDESNKIETKKVKKISKKLSSEENNKDVKVSKKKSVNSPIEETKPADELIVPKKRSVKMKKTTSKEVLNSDNELVSSENLIIKTNQETASTSSINNTENISSISQEITQVIDPTMSSIELQKKSKNLLSKNDENIDKQGKLENETKKKGEISTDIKKPDQIRTEIVVETKKIDLKKSENKMNEPAKSENKMKEPAKSENKMKEPAKSENKMNEPAKSENKMKEPAKSENKMNEPAKSENKMKEPAKSENKMNEPAKSEKQVVEHVKSENKTFDAVKSEFSLENKKNDNKTIESKIPGVLSERKKVESVKAKIEPVKSETLSENKKKEIKKTEETKPETLSGNSNIILKPESLSDTKKIDSEKIGNKKTELMRTEIVSENKKIKPIKSDILSENKIAESKKTESLSDTKKIESENENIGSIKSKSTSENEKMEREIGSDAEKIKPIKSENKEVKTTKSETLSENKKIPRPNDIPIFNKLKKDEMNSSDRSKLSNPEEVKVFDKVSESMSVSESGDITVICNLKKRNSLTRKTEDFNKPDYSRSLSNPEEKRGKSDFSPTSDKSIVKRFSSIIDKTISDQISTEKSNILSTSQKLDEKSGNISTLPPIPCNGRKDTEALKSPIIKKDVQNQFINLTPQTQTNESNHVDNSTSQKITSSLANSNKDVDEFTNTSDDKFKLSNSSAENEKSEESSKIKDVVSVINEASEVTKKKSLLERHQSPKVVRNKEPTQKKSTVKENSDGSNENVNISEETLKKEKISGIARRYSPKSCENSSVRKSPPSIGTREDSPKSSSERIVNRRQSPTSIPVKRAVKNTEDDIKTTLNNHETSPKIMGSSSGDLKRRPSPKTVNIDSVLRRKWSPKENKSPLTHSISSEAGRTIEQPPTSPKKSSSSDRIKKISPPKFDIPKKDVKREISPKKDVNRAISPIKRGISPKKDYKKEVNISTVTDKEISPSKVVKREISPIKRRISPKKDVTREISPKKDVKSEISPNKRGMSPKVDYKNDLKSSSTCDKDSKKEISPTKESKREISPRKTYKRESLGKKESLRDNKSLQSTTAKENEERVPPTDKTVLKKDNFVEKSISSKEILNKTVSSDNKESDNRSELEKRRTSLKLTTVTKEESILRKPIALRMNLSKFGVPQPEYKRRSIKEKDLSSRSFGTDREDVTQVTTEKNGLDPVKTSSDENQKKVSENDEQSEMKIVKKTRIVRKVKSDSAKSALVKLESDLIKDQQEIMNQSNTEQDQNESIRNQSELIDGQTKRDSFNSSINDNKSLLKRFDSKSFSSSVRDETSAFVKFQKGSDSMKSPTLESDKLKMGFFNVKTSKDSLRDDLVKTSSESVKSGIDLVKSVSDSVKTNLDSVKSNTDLVKISTDKAKSSSVLINSSADLVKQSSESVETSTELMNTSSDSVETSLKSSVKSSVVSDKTKLVQSNVGTLMTNSFKSDADLNVISKESVRASAESVSSMSKSVNSIMSTIDSVETSSSKSFSTTATDKISSESINSSTDSVGSNLNSVKKNYISVKDRLDSIKSSTDSVNTLSSKSVRNSSTDLNQTGTELFNSLTDSSSTIPKPVQKNNTVVASSKSDKMIACKSCTDSVNTSSKSVKKISVSVQENDSVSKSSKSDSLIADLEQLSSDYIKSSSNSVNSNLKSIKNNASSVKFSSDSVKSSTDSIQVSTDTVKEMSKSVKSNVDSVKSRTDSVKSSSDSVRICSDLAKLDYSVKTSPNSVRICSDLAKLDYSDKFSPDRVKLNSKKISSDNEFTDSVRSSTNSVRICSDLAKLDYSDKVSPDRVKLNSKKVSTDTFTDSVRSSANSVKSSTDSVRICSDLAKLDYSDKVSPDRIKLSTKKVSSDSVKTSTDSVELSTESDKIKLSSSKKTVSVDVGSDLVKSSSELEKKSTDKVQLTSSKKVSSDLVKSTSELEKNSTDKVQLTSSKKVSSDLVKSTELEKNSTDKVKITSSKKVSTDLVNSSFDSIKSGNKMEKVSREVENADSGQVSRDSVTKLSSSTIGESGLKISSDGNSSDNIDTSRLGDLRKNRDNLSLDLKSVTSSSVKTVKKKKLVKKIQGESGLTLNSNELSSPSEKSVLEKFLELKPKESRIEKTIKSLRRNSLGQMDVFTESNLLKRATSMEDFKSCSDLSPSPANYNSDEEVFKKKKKGKIRKGSVYDAIQSRILKGKTENIKDVTVKIDNEENTSRTDAGESHSSSSNQNDFPDDANSFSLDNSSELGSLDLTDGSTEVEERIKRKSFYTRFNPSSSKITFKRYY